MVVDESGAYGGRYEATKDGFALVAMEATDKGVTVAGLAATTEEDAEEKNKPAADATAPEA